MFVVKKWHVFVLVTLVAIAFGAGNALASGDTPFSLRWGNYEVADITSFVDDKTGLVCFVTAEGSIDCECLCGEVRLEASEVAELVEEPTEQSTEESTDEETPTKPIISDDAIKKFAIICFCIAGFSGFMAWVTRS